MPSQEKAWLIFSQINKSMHCPFSFHVYLLSKWIYQHLTLNGRWFIDESDVNFSGREPKYGWNGILEWKWNALRGKKNLSIPWQTTTDNFCSWFERDGSSKYTCAACLGLPEKKWFPCTTCQNQSSPLDLLVVGQVGRPKPTFWIFSNLIKWAAEAHGSTSSSHGTCCMGLHFGEPFYLLKQSGWTSEVSHL